MTPEASWEKDTVPREVERIPGETLSELNKSH